MTETQDLCATDATSQGDCAPPKTKITKAPKQKLKTKKKKAKVSIEFNSSEATSTFACQLDDEKPASCSSPFKAKVGKGKHVFSVVATDAAANADPTPGDGELQGQEEAQAQGPSPPSRLSVRQLPGATDPSQLDVRF